MAHHRGRGRPGRPVHVGSGSWDERGHGCRLRLLAGHRAPGNHGCLPHRSVTCRAGGSAMAWAAPMSTCTGAANWYRQAGGPSTLQGSLLGHWSASAHLYGWPLTAGARPSYAMSWTAPASLSRPWKAEDRGIKRWWLGREGIPARVCRGQGDAGGLPAHADGTGRGARHGRPGRFCQARKEFSEAGRRVRARDDAAASAILAVATGARMASRPTPRRRHFGLAG